MLFRMSRLPCLRRLPQLNPSAKRKKSSLTPRHDFDNPHYHHTMGPGDPGVVNGGYECVTPSPPSPNLR